MKSVLIFFVSIVAHIEINAQVFAYPKLWGSQVRFYSSMQTVDFGRIRVMYALNASDIKDTETFDDWHRLDIGSNFSVYYSYFTFLNDSLLDVWRKNNPNARTAPTRLTGDGNPGKSLWAEYYYSDILKNFDEGILTQYTYMPMNVTNLKRIEAMHLQNWTLHEDTATIAGYLCQKATTTFRGRDFEAWFTPMIPISNGPWKFGGLPGLILKLYDTDRLYVFECTNIFFSQETFPVKIYDENIYMEADRDRFRKVVREVNEEYFSRFGFNPERPPVYPPYHPLELE